MIWTFFLILVYGARAQSLSAPFSCILYMTLLNQGHAFFTFTTEPKVGKYTVTDFKYFPVAFFVILHTAQALMFVRGH
jgi:hypothetical protein